MGVGIGLATAKAFAKAGEAVIVADRDKGNIGRAAEDVRPTGHNAVGMICDVTDKTQVTKTGRRDLRSIGRCL